ncbi:MAG: methyl-accepting chemotaxis protein, partial [Jannaschia sp.]
VADVATSARHQANAISDLDESVSAIEGDVRENAAMSEQMLSASRALDTDAEELSDTFGLFELGGRDAARSDGQDVAA